MKEKRHVTIDIRSYLFVPQRDDRYHYPLVAIKKKELKRYLPPETEPLV